MMLSLITVSILIFSIGGYFLYINKKKKKPEPVYISFKRGYELTDLPVVTFYQNNKKFHFLLDTGCSFSSLNPAMLSELTYFDTGQRNSYYGVDGILNQAPIVALELNYKNKQYGGYFQVLVDESSFKEIKKDSGVTITGLLGSDFLEQYKYVLDFEKMIAYSIT